MENINNLPSNQDENKGLSNQPTMLVRKDSMPQNIEAEEQSHSDASSGSTGVSEDLDFAPTIRRDAFPQDVPQPVQPNTPKIPFVEPVVSYPPPVASYSQSSENPAVTPPQKGGKKVWLIVAIVLLVMCCCCFGAGILLQTMGGGLEEIMRALN